MSHTLHTTHCHFILHTAPEWKQAQCTADVRIKGVLYCGLLSTKSTVLDHRLEWDFVLPKSDSELSEPHISPCTLPLHIAHCTRTQTGAVYCRCQDYKCLVVWSLFTKSTVYVVGCLSLSSISSLEWDYFLPERELFIAVSFWHSSDLLCPPAAGQVAQVAAESPTQGSLPSCNRGASRNLHSEILAAFMFLPERKLFIAVSFWHNSNDSPRIYQLLYLA